MSLGNPKHPVELQLDLGLVLEGRLNLMESLLRSHLKFHDRYLEVQEEVIMAAEVFVRTRSYDDLEKLNAKLNELRSVVMDAWTK